MITETDAKTMLGQEIEAWAAAGRTPATVPADFTPYQQYHALRTLRMIRLAGKPTGPFHAKLEAYRRIDAPRSASDFADTPENRAMLAVHEFVAAQIGE